MCWFAPSNEEGIKATDGLAQPIFSVPVISAFTKTIQNIGYLLIITFVLDRYHNSLAALSPAQYKRDLVNLTSNFVLSYIYP